METQETSKSTISEMEQTKQDREKLRAENDAMEAELLRAEKLRAQSRMAGKSVIVETPTPVNPEIEKKNQAMEFWAGTEISKALKKYG